MRRHYVDGGSLEGILDIRSECITLRDELNGNVTAVLPNFGTGILDSAIPKVFKEAKGKRVSVSGNIHYRDDVPRLIFAESLRVFPPESELPQLSDIAPINITDGLSSEEHVRRMRDDE